ncbi:MAG TPA: SprT family zinc-dependent metalloprotease [Oleiagrimonas sp.]|nr:SprT family zinc-dependent metalloprotease [Oleiagrimonas sp.]
MGRPTTPGDWLELPTPGGDTIRVLKAAHPRARRLRLTVSARGARVSCPVGTHPARVMAFVRDNVEWLERKIEEMRLDDEQFPPLRVGRATEMPWRGQTLRLDWGEAAYPRIEQRGGTLRLMIPRPHTRALPIAHGLLAAFLEDGMRADIARWLPRYVPRLGLAPTAVRIRPMKSMWGSLDTRDRINLDLALALAPPAAFRYVLIHELCHLKVRNHSPAFWQRVAGLCPDYKIQRDWLRDNGAMLKAQMDRLIADVADA